jgi:hypothetical protein
LRLLKREDQGDFEGWEITHSCNCLDSSSRLIGERGVFSDCFDIAALRFPLAVASIYSALSFSFVWSDRLPCETVGYQGACSLFEWYVAGQSCSRS